MGMRRSSSFVIVCLLVLNARIASAQPPAESLDQLRVLVTPGEPVGVTLTSGREVNGLVARIDDRRLVIRGRNAEYTFEQSDFWRVRQKRDDSLANGARNGFIGGALFGALAVLPLMSEVHDAVPLAIVAVGLYGGIGSAIGVGVDAMIRSDRVIYEAPRHSAGIRVMPIVSAERKGAALSIGF